MSRVKTEERLVIAFDGPDGVGKSTQIELTASWLRSLGHDVHTARASGGTPIGEELRKASLSDHPRPPEVDVYISLAMHTALGVDIQKRIKSGQICLIDRSPLAILAYNTIGSQLENQQLGYDAMEKMLRLWNLDALFSFEADQEIVNERRHARTDKPADFYEKQGAAYHDRVRRGYSMATNYLKANPLLVKQVIMINAEPSVDEIQKTIEKHLQKML